MGKLRLRKGKGGAQLMLSPSGLQMNVLWGPITWGTQDVAEDLRPSRDKGRR